jgi:hypothetical protein
MTGAPKLAVVAGAGQLATVRAELAAALARIAELEREQSDSVSLGVLLGIKRELRELRTEAARLRKEKETLLQLIIRLGAKE